MADGRKSGFVPRSAVEDIPAIAGFVLNGKLLELIRGYKPGGFLVGRFLVLSLIAKVAYLEKSNLILTEATVRWFLKILLAASSTHYKSRFGSDKSSLHGELKKLLSATTLPASDEGQSTWQRDLFGSLTLLDSSNTNPCLLSDSLNQDNHAHFFMQLLGRFGATSAPPGTSNRELLFLLDAMTQVMEGNFSVLISGELGALSEYYGVQSEGRVLPRLHPDFFSNPKNIDEAFEGFRRSIIFQVFLDAVKRFADEKKGVAPALPGHHGLDDGVVGMVVAESKEGVGALEAERAKIIELEAELQRVRERAALREGFFIAQGQVKFYLGQQLAYLENALEMITSAFAKIPRGDINKYFIPPYFAATDTGLSFCGLFSRFDNEKIFDFFTRCIRLTGDKNDDDKRKSCWIACFFEMRKIVADLKDLISNHNPSVDNFYGTLNQCDELKEVMLYLLSSLKGVFEESKEKPVLVKSGKLKDLVKPLTPLLMSLFSTEDSSFATAQQATQQALSAMQGMGTEMRRVPGTGSGETSMVRPLIRDSVVVGPLENKIRKQRSFLSAPGGTARTTGYDSNPVVRAPASVRPSSRAKGSRRESTGSGETSGISRPGNLALVLGTQPTQKEVPTNLRDTTRSRHMV